MAGTGRATRPLLVVLLAGLGVVLAAPSADAHANLRSSEPAAGAVLQGAPESVVLSFTEAPEVGLSRVDVLDAAGAPVQTGEAGAVPGDELGLRVPVVGPLPTGTYTVSWRVVSRVDGHTTAGAFAFGVGVDAGQVAPPPEPEQPGASPLEIAGRLFLIGGLVVALGGSAASVAIVRPAPPAVRTYALAGALVAVPGLIALAFAQRSASEVGFGELFGTSIGRALIWRAAALGVVIAGTVVARRASEPATARAAWMVGALAAGGAMLAEVAAGHAAAESAVLLNVGAQWVHFLAAGVWIGGLGALLLGVRGVEDDAKAAAVRRFSAAAGVALLLVAGTGTLRALNALPSWGSLVSSGYGRSVLIKASLLVALAGLGAANRFRNVRAARRSLVGLRRISRIELGVALVVIAATAIMTAISPPQDRAGAADQGPSLVAEGADFGTTVRVRLEIRPGRPGPNEFLVRVLDYDDATPVEADRVALLFSLAGGDVAPSELELEPRGEGRYGARGSNLSVFGRYDIDVLIQNGADSVEVLLTLATPCGARVLSAAEPVIYVIDLAEGATVQGYADPGRAGTNEIHFTYFDADGGELGVPELPAIRAVPREGPIRELEVRRFSEGHFVAGGTLQAGGWRFESVARDVAGASLAACFEEMIEG